MSMFHGWRRALIAAATAGSLAAIAAPASALAAAGGPSGAGIQPVEVTGNLESKDCPAGTFGYTIQGGDLATNPHVFDGFSVTTTTSTTALGQVVAFSANMGVDVVFVKGGPNANVYTYSPERASDTGLHAPVNPMNGRYHDISHVTFCVDYELQVSKTAATTFDRDYDWTIDKSNDAGTDPVKLAPGQTYTVDYEVKVTAGAPTDSNWAVSGQITIANPAPSTATGVAVSDVITKTGEADIAAAVDCPATTIAAGGSMTCTYAAALPDGSARTNTATATTTTAGIGAGSGSAAVTFGDPTNVFDDCVDVTDDKTTGTQLALGTACVADSPKTFTYSKTFGPFANECVQHTFVNTAVFTTNDTKQTGSDTSTVVFDVQCVPEGGCTLTQGYWKTHSDRGPAPYDNAWANLGALEEDTPFFGTGKTWYQVFWTPPQGGNAFLILAHQYMAARLNQLNGASVPAAVQAAMTEAVALFEKYDNDGIPKPSDISRTDRARMIELAGILGSFNEGKTGPGHCDEDDTSKT